jgi:predicted DNA-binding mobile mystery protein A
MRPQDRASARRHLDKRLKLLQKSESALARPPRGWVRAIREALGMTAAQLGKRLGVSQQRVLAVEKAEASGSITLESLARAARALDCRLVYALIPRKPLESLVEDRAALRAKKRLISTRHTMALEAQSVEEADEAAQLERLIRNLVAHSGPKLWDET